MTRFDYAMPDVFSPAVTRGGVTCVSAFTGAHADGDGVVLPDGIREQADVAHEKSLHFLEREGRTPDDISHVIEYVTAGGLKDYDPRPGVTTVVVEATMRRGALIEVEITACDGLTFFSCTGAGDDLVAQTRNAYEQAGRILEAAGLGFDRVVKTLDYVTPDALADYKYTGRVRKEFLGPVYPGAAGILMPALRRPDALIQVDFTASVHAPVAVNPGWERYAKLTYSPAVRAGDILFMSGQAALDPETQAPVHAGDVVAQAEYTFGNILKVLEAAGGGHLVRVTDYVTPAGLKRYGEVADVKRRLLQPPYPASGAFVCHSLLRPEFEIELDPLAVLA